MATEYPIVTVNDFRKVPVDRRELCVREFLVWMLMVDEAEKKFKDVLAGEPAEFTWIDDNEHTATINIASEKETLIIKGHMKEFGA